MVGLFAQRGYNIDTLTVAPTDDDTLSRLTMTTQGDDKMAEQMVKQLHKLIDTIKVVDLTVGSHIERELMLVRLKRLTMMFGLSSRAVWNISRTHCRCDSNYLYRSISWRR